MECIHQKSTNKSGIINMTNDKVILSFEFIVGLKDGHYSTKCKFNAISNRGLIQTH